MAAVAVVSNMATMGANDFAQFILSYFIQVIMNLLERMYVAPFAMRQFLIWPRNRFILNKIFRRQRLTREQKALGKIP